MVEKLKEAVKAQGVSVFISRHPCSLIEAKYIRSRHVQAPIIQINSEKCEGCLVCVNQFCCPAFLYNKLMKIATIDQETCRGCKACVHVCSHEAIYQVMH